MVHGRTFRRIPRQLCYGVVHYEQHQEIEQAIIREKQLKKWNRKWKLDLIESQNPDWVDHYEAI